LAPSFTTKGTLDRAALAQLVFQNQEALERLNKLVHPAVAEAFTDFIAKNNTAPLLVKEAAILFETEGYKSCDDVILVCAPKEERILRVIQRDGVGRAEVEARMAKQWEDAKKRPLADFVIENDNLASAKQQLDSILNQLLPQQKD